MLLALASVGGVGYASSAAQDAAVSVKRVVTPKDVIQIVKRGSAIDQYRKPKAKKVKKAKKARRGQGHEGPGSGPDAAALHGVVPENSS